MFTGLIESVCTVSSASGGSKGMKLQLKLDKEAKTGDSIAINGVCLTVSRFASGATEFDVSGETVAKTNIKNLRSGSPVNIERAMSVNDRFGGHFVQGHIDSTGKVKKIEKKGDFWQFTFEGSEDIKELLIPKGSIAVDGVSLTIAEVGDKSFSTAIIPTTFENTIFKYYKIGDSVNLETDILCRIVRKQLENILPSKNLTIDKLKNLGF
ncbi:MAG: riboflavin synthase [Phycisphaerales bacterium]